jgi:hypothetical protein
MRRVLFVISLLVIVLAACAPVAATEQPGSEEPAAPTETPVDVTPAQRAALEALSEKLGLPTAQIKIVSTEAVTWPDGCLGIVRIGVMCTQAQVPGFRIMLEADGKSYEFHTNQEGTIALPAEAAGVSELAVIKQLAANLGVEESDISVVSSEPVEFGDACLGVAIEGVACAQVVTPGRIIVLEAKGVQYAYHTSEDGSRVQPATVAIVWKREGGIAGFCDSLTVFRSGEVYSSSCKPQADGKMGTLAKLLSAQEQKQFNDWMSRVGEAELDASDPAGVADRMVVTLNIFGSGDKPPTKAEQEQLFEFAQDLFNDLAR